MLLQPIKERISDRLINDSELSCSQIPSVVDLVFEEIQEIEARLEAATQGPWDFETIPETGESRVVVRSNTGDPMLDVSVAPHGVRAEDAEFITHAPEDIRALLDEVKAVRDAVARHPDVMECSEYSDDEPVSCGWKRAYEDVVWALNGGKQ